jgi:hypothetical protein
MIALRNKKAEYAMGRPFLRWRKRKATKDG